MDKKELTKKDRHIIRMSILNEIWEEYSESSKADNTKIEEMIAMTTDDILKSILIKEKEKREKNLKVLKTLTIEKVETADGKLAGFSIKPVFAGKEKTASEWSGFDFPASQLVEELVKAERIDANKILSSYSGPRLLREKYGNDIIEKLKNEIPIANDRTLEKVLEKILTY